MTNICQNKWKDLPKKIECPNCKSPMRLGGCIKKCDEDCDGPFYYNWGKMGCEFCLGEIINPIDVIDIRTLKPLKRLRKNDTR